MYILISFILPHKARGGIDSLAGCMGMYVAILFLNSSCCFC